MKTYKKDTIIEGKVTGVEDYGIFLSFGDGCSGLIHISEISNSFVKNPNEYASIGDMIKAKIISKEGNNHYKLSIKGIKKEQTDIFKKDEEKHGFNSLSKMLDFWIKDTVNKINKKTKKE